MNIATSKFRALIEAAVVIWLMARITRLLTYVIVSKEDLLTAAALTAIFAIIAFIPILRSAPSLYAILAAMTIGFLTFNFMRYYGLVRWPLSHPDSISAYYLLLYYHFILAATVITPTIVAAKLTNAKTTLRTGHFKMFSQPYKISLAAILIIGWAWAAKTIMSSTPANVAPLYILVTIALIKAFLTSLTEELCWRGIVQPTAIGKFGTVPGILFQSLLYTAFHLYLTPAIFSKPVFVTLVFLLGLSFGSISYLTRGIGWAVAAHWAIDMVVEWQNIS